MCWDRRHRSGPFGRPPPRHFRQPRATVCRPSSRCDCSIPFCGVFCDHWCSVPPREQRKHLEIGVTSGQESERAQEFRWLVAWYRNKTIQRAQYDMHMSVTKQLPCTPLESVLDPCQSGTRFRKADLFCLQDALSIPVNYCHREQAHITPVMPRIQNGKLLCVVACSMQKRTSLEHFSSSRGIQATKSRGGGGTGSHDQNRTPVCCWCVHIHIQTLSSFQIAPRPFLTALLTLYHVLYRWHGRNPSRSSGGLPSLSLLITPSSLLFQPHPVVHPSPSTTTNVPSHTRLVTGRVAFSGCRH